VKTIELGDTQLETCVADAQEGQVVLTRGGRPVAVLIGLDEEQEQLGRSERFWHLIAERRRQPTISRAELERRLGAKREDAQD
jgi:antitoxin (DNA-binding transcriptional repressor) of toxin-antitoxin stability system